MKYCQQSFALLPSNEALLVSAFQLPYPHFFSNIQLLLLLCALLFLLLGDGDLIQGLDNGLDVLRHRSLQLE
jgi:hypothetical protein